MEEGSGERGGCGGTELGRGGQGKAVGDGEGRAFNRKVW